MTDQIAEEIAYRQKKSKAFAAEIHGQEGAQPDTTPGAPTEAELRATVDETIVSSAASSDDNSSLSEPDSSLLDLMDLE